MANQQSSSIYRSEEMAYCELILDSEIVYKSIAALGELNRVQFIDLNENAVVFHKKFTPQIRKCDDMENQIRRIERIIAKHPEIKISPARGEIPVMSAKDFQKLAETLEECETKLNDDERNISSLKESKLDLIQLQGALELFEIYFGHEAGHEIDQPTSVTHEMLRHHPSVDHRESVTEPPAFQMQHFVGVIERSKVSSFNKMCWRISNGNIFVRTAPIMEELINAKGDQVFYDAFVAFFQGSKLKEKLEHIAKAYHAKIFKCPTNVDDRLKMMSNIKIRRDDIEEVVSQARFHKQAVIENAANQCRRWAIQVRKVKACYHTMNMLSVDVANKYVVGQCWIPAFCLPKVKNALDEAVGQNEDGYFLLNRLPTPKTNIPTYFRSNKLTKGFQSIVNAFSIAKYQEVNPALFTTITFPFLFSVMFGDFGHGLILLFLALWMVLNERSLKIKAAESESFSMIFGGRYVILLMAFFSIYAGLLYNDCFAKTFHIFPSSWEPKASISRLVDHAKLELDPASETGPWPYPFGIDPAWEESENRINYINSMKMKLSIILGVAQMLFGLFLSLMNHLHFKKYINIWFEFIPQIIFISCLFVYMDALIIAKWIYFDIKSVHKAPSILITMINMCLFKYLDANDPSTPPSEAFVSEHLQPVQYFLIIMAILSVPWMLLVKPFYLRHKMERRALGELHTVLIETSSLNEHSHHHDLESGPVQEMTAQTITANQRYQDVALETRPRSDTALSRISAYASNRASHHHHEDNVGEEHHDGELSEPHEEFSEIFIHQAIHTIEYVLGLISHTASYLRLWALSLAHSELSAVLWTMVLRRALNFAAYSPIGFILVIVIFIFWAVLTVAILVMMEGMSAFLHALRLHWVEFQSKFYEGGGVAFKAFNFKDCYAKK